MAIHYALYENKMTDSPDEFIAKVTAVSAADLKTIIARMADMGTTVTESDILAVFADMRRAVESLLADGFNVNLDGLCNLRCTIKGIFDSPVDNFDPARHRIDVSASAGRAIRKAVAARAEITKSEAVIPAPSPMEFIDTAGGSVNSTITVGNIGTINGYRLKFDPAAVDEGIFLIAADGSEIKVPSIATNKPSQLVFLVPELAGFGTEFRLEARSRMDIEGGDLRTGCLDDTLTKV